MNFEIKDIIFFVLYFIFCFFSGIVWSKWRKSDFYFTFILSFLVTPIIASAFMLVADTGKYFSTNKPGFYIPKIFILPKSFFKIEGVSKNNIKLFVSALLILFIITNPSLSDFHDFIGSTHSGKRNSNFFLFSIYSNGRNTYVGVLKNFFEL